jgi:hypothetical protein
VCLHRPVLKRVLSFLYSGNITGEMVKVAERRVTFALCTLHSIQIETRCTCSRHSIPETFSLIPPVLSNQVSISLRVSLRELYRSVFMHHLTQISISQSFQLVRLLLTLSKTALNQIGITLMKFSDCRISSLPRMPQFCYIPMMMKT